MLCVSCCTNMLYFQCLVKLIQVIGDPWCEQVCDTFVAWKFDSFMLYSSFGTQEPRKRWLSKHWLTSFIAYTKVYCKEFCPRPHYAIIELDHALLEFFLWSRPSNNWKIKVEPFIALLLSKFTQSIYGPRRKRLLRKKKHMKVKTLTTLLNFIRPHSRFSRLLSVAKTTLK